MNQADPQFSEKRRDADVAFQKSLAQLETLIDPPTSTAPEAQPTTSTPASPHPERPAWEIAGADLEEFLEVEQ